MQITTLHLGGLATNCYILPCGDGGAVVVDIGDGAAKLMEKLQELQLSVKAVLLTHGHYDHVAGVEEIRLAYHCPVYIHEADERMLRSGDANLAWQLTDKPFTPVQSYELLRDGDSLTIGDLTFRVMHTPGHTPGGVCYFVDDLMFSGDTLFAGSIGRIDLGGNAQDMRESLDKLGKLEGDYTIYPGHFDSSTLAWERAYNPYLRG